MQIEKPIYGGAFLARVEGKATFVPLTLPGEQARVRIVEEKRGYATAEPEEIVRLRRNVLCRIAVTLGPAGDASISTRITKHNLTFKQAILRETLERGGVRAPEKIEVLAGNPWQYRNRIRLAVDSAGRVGYRARRSHDLVPIERMSDCRAAAGEGSDDAEEIFEAMKPAISCRGKFRFFSNADETEMLASIFVRESGTRGFDQFFDEWKRRIPTLAGVELVEEGRRGQGTENYLRSRGRLH